MIPYKLQSYFEQNNIKIDFNKFKKTCNANKIELAREIDFKNSFPDCELGAQPLLGNLYNLEVIADNSFNPNQEIWFNCGTHSDMAKLTYQQFNGLVRPQQSNISV